MREEEKKLKISLSQYINFTTLGLFLLEDIYLLLKIHAYKWISFNNEFPLGTLKVMFIISGFGGGGVCTMFASF